MFRQASLTANYDVAPNTTILPLLIPSYQCPSGVVTESTYITGKTAHYYAVVGPKGTNPATNAAYAVKSGASHGAISLLGILGINSKVTLTSITDGTSNTIMVGELSWKNANCYRPWTRGWDGNAVALAKNVVNAINTVPYNGSNNFNDVSFGSQHTGGANFLMGDGSVRYISETIAIPAYLALASRDGGEVNSN